MTTHASGQSLALVGKATAVVVTAYLWSIAAGANGVGAAQLLPYGAILILGLLVGLAIGRGDARVPKADRSDEMELRLAARIREVEKRHQTLRAIEHDQAIAEERQRLMREMHDGLGSSLMSSLVLVEQGKLDMPQVACLLRESIEDLKLTVDSLEPMENDLLTLLGTLRYRLGRRLEAAGIRLDWQVAETPTLSWLNPTSTLQVLRMLQEILTNVLKHARASAVCVETGFDARSVWIRITDNGLGFDIDTVRRSAHRGRGIQNIERRAAALRGEVRIDSRPGVSVVTVSMPR